MHNSKQNSWFYIYEYYFTGKAAPDQILNMLILKGAAREGFEHGLKKSLQRLPWPGTATTMEEYRAGLSDEHRDLLDEFERSPEGTELTAFNLIELHFARLNQRQGIRHEP